MNTTSEERTNASRTQDDDFLTYPLYKVVGVFKDDKEVEDTVAELHSKVLHRMNSNHSVAYLERTGLISTERSMVFGRVSYAMSSIWVRIRRFWSDIRKIWKMVIA